MSEPEGTFEMDPVGTFAVPTGPKPVGAEVARILRLTTDRLEAEIGPIESIMATTEVTPKGPVIHLRFWWTTGTTQPQG